MAATGDYRKLKLRAQPERPGGQNAESRYWRKFKQPTYFTCTEGITHLEYAPKGPCNLAVTSSVRVELYSATTHEVTKTFSRFKGTAYSGSFRHDGKLLVAGCEDASVQVFDMNSRAVLRTFHGHRAPTRVTKFCCNGTNVMSGSDDHSVRMWDIPTEAQTALFEGHTDYIRCGVTHPSTADVIVSGSYDHTIRGWDARAPPESACVFKLDHEKPVEDLVIFPSGGVIVSAGGPYIRVWDILGGGKLLHEWGNHQKTVTSLCLDGSTSSRLLSGSLDNHVKVYDVTDFRTTHSLKYSNPILSLALSSDNQHLAVGMVDGSLCMRKRRVVMEDAVTEKKEKVLRAGSYQYFLRGKSAVPSGEDFKVEHMRRARLKDYDVFLKKFQYSNALDAALATKRPIVVVSLLEELLQRDGLKAALGGRDETTLEPLIIFLVKNITNPHFAQLLIDVANMLVDTYASVLGQSPVIDELFMRLQSRVGLEIRFQKQMFSLQGTLELLLAGNAGGASAGEAPIAGGEGARPATAS